MRILSDVDGDEVSLVKRAANRRRFLLLKGDQMDQELSDIIDVPYGREGSILDEIRKDGVDEATERAVIMAVRLLKGTESDLSPETIEKLGRELYPVKNVPLNSTTVASPGELTGSSPSSEDEDVNGDADGPDKDGSATDAELEGSGSAPPVVKDQMSEEDCEEPDEDDMKKADFSTDERKRLAGQGQALPDGSFPIRNKSDLSNAISAYGRAGDKPRAKSWIIRRARALGATSMLPDTWSVSKADENDETERGTVEIPVPVRKEDGTWDLSGVPEASRPFFAEMIEKADKTAQELAEAREQLQKSEDNLLSRRMIEKAARYSHVAATDDLTPILKAAYQNLDEETFTKLEEVLKTAEERIEKGNLFAEAGRSYVPDASSATTGNDAYSQLVQKANELVEKADNLSFEAAFDRALQQNPRLYDQYMAETSAARIAGSYGGAV